MFTKLEEIQLKKEGRYEEELQKQLQQPDKKKKHNYSKINFKKKYGSYKEYLKSSDWRVVKLRKLKSRMPYRCYCCNTYKNLDLHHISYTRLGREKLSDLTWVCRNCHELIHKKSKALKYKDLKRSMKQVKKYNKSKLKCWITGEHNNKKSSIAKNIIIKYLKNQY